MPEKFKESNFPTLGEQRIETGSSRGAEPPPERPVLTTSQRLPPNKGIILRVQVLVDTGEGEPEITDLGMSTGKLLEFLPAGTWKVEAGQFFDLRVRVAPEGVGAFAGEDK